MKKLECSLHFTPAIEVYLRGAVSSSYQMLHEPTILQHVLHANWTYTFATRLHAIWKMIAKHKVLHTNILLQHEHVFNHFCKEI